jgi:hypothetical protein
MPIGTSETRATQFAVAWAFAINSGMASVLWPNSRDVNGKGSRIQGSRNFLSTSMRARVLSQ